jgi:4-amino-4-deoxy-L-arabinose transferase-like glycosyltransferase
MSRWILVFFVLLGLIIRISGITTHPSGFTPDEASFGYDAYSILKTGRDQWGTKLPLVFKSFGDDKLPVYVYLTVPSVAIFGLNEFAVRLPNAILGAFAIPVIYLLVEELFKNKKLALFSAFLLSISAWHVMLSRGAFEANLTTFFLPLAVFLFLKSLKNSKYLVLAFLVFIVNIFTYHTARILTPGILLFLIFNYRGKLKENKIFYITFIFSIVLLLISITGLFFGGSRISSSAISDVNYSSDRYSAQVVGENDLLAKVFYNKPLYVTKQFLQNYFSYFSPQFLFTNGAGEGTYGMVPGIGVLYFVEIILLVGFIWKVFAIKEKSKAINLILFWIFISPIPAALTKGPGYAANRIAFIIPALIILLGIGGMFIFENLKTKKMKILFTSIYLGLLAINFIYVSEKYWVGQVANNSEAMVYGVGKLINELNTNYKYIDKIIFSKNISEPQIYVAFYSMMDPNFYQNQSKNWKLVNGWVDQQVKYSLGKYTFRTIDQIVDFKVPNNVLVGKADDFQPQDQSGFLVSYPNLKHAYYIVTTK